MNNGNDNHWLKVATVGTVSNKNGIGARITITSAAGSQIREVLADGFSDMSTLNAHFGIGEDTSIDELTIHWPSGITQTILNPPVDTLIVVGGEHQYRVADMACPRWACSQPHHRTAVPERLLRTDRYVHPPR
ncbi:MAG: ASPIC/UnbV domain-containing protein [Flavobacteriales bacterium]